MVRIRSPRPGDLRQIVTVQEVAESADSFGAAGTETWTAVTTIGKQGDVRARVSPVSGGERWAAEQRAAEVTHEVELYWFAGLTHKNRLLYGSRVLNIVYIANEDEMNRRLILHCTEETD